MTGTGKRVIDIVETEHECVDRVLVFLKPGLSDVQLSRAAGEADSYARRLIVKKRRSGALLGAALAFIAGAAVGFGAAYLIFVANIF